MGTHGGAAGGGDATTGGMGQRGNVGIGKHEGSEWSAIGKRKGVKACKQDVPAPWEQLPDWAVYKAEISALLHLLQIPNSDTGV